MKQNIQPAMILKTAKFKNQHFIPMDNYIKDMNELKQVIKDLYERIEVLEKQSEDFVTNTQMSWKNHKWNT